MSLTVTMNHLLPSVLAAVTPAMHTASILDPTARTSPVLRYSWYAALVVVPIGCAVLDFGMHVTGALYQVAHYVGRCNEDFVAALLISVALAVIAGRARGEHGAVRPDSAAAPARS